MYRAGGLPRGAAALPQGPRPRHPQVGSSHCFISISLSLYIYIYSYYYILYIYIFLFLCVCMYVYIYIYIYISPCHPAVGLLGREFAKGGLVKGALAAKPLFARGVGSSV